MNGSPRIRLARGREAGLIARMSRDLVEEGLGWRWTPLRVLAAVRDPTCNVAVIDGPELLAGFGIMQYGEDTAHLSLLAVHPDRRHQKLGSALVAWLEKPAEVAGIACVQLEARADNPGAIDFYHAVGYHDAGRVAGYYGGRIDAVRLEKHLFTGLGTTTR